MECQLRDSYLLCLVSAPPGSVPPLDAGPNVEHMAFAWNTVRLQSTLPAAAKRGKLSRWLYVCPATLHSGSESQQCD